MAGWLHQCNGYEPGKTSRDGEGQGGLSCCIPWGHNELDMTGWLNNEQVPAGISVTVWAGKVDSGSALLCPHPHLTRPAQFCLFYRLSFWIRCLWRKQNKTKQNKIAFVVGCIVSHNINLERKPWFSVVDSWPERCAGRNILIYKAKVHKAM